MKFLVTGVSGFVGSATARHLADRGYQIVGQARARHLALNSLAKEEPLSKNIQFLETDLADTSRFVQALSGCTAVLHCAARVHQVRDASSDPLLAYRQVNCDATLALANAAAAQGVRRFVFLSSIKVNGERTVRGERFRADDLPAPQDPYGISKLEAEQGLRTIAAQTGMEVVIVRPPLVYGPGVKANFFTVMRWLARGLPLPLGAIDNQRSLIGLGNLVDLLAACLVHPAAANQTFLASDGHDVSTTELLKALAEALHVKARLIPLPQPWLERTLALAGRTDMAARLCGSLAVDIEKTRSMLEWIPPYSLAQGLQPTAAHFLAQR